MSELARNIAIRLRTFLRDRRHAPRCKARLSFSVSVVGQKPASNVTHRPYAIEGHTLDLSADGLALIVPAIRVGEHYLMGEDRCLEICLELPEGSVVMQVSPVRYESLEDGTETGYVIGVKVEQMSEQDRAQYLEYINGLLHK
jgi:hypothetical protein